MLGRTRTRLLLGMAGLALAAALAILLTPFSVTEGRGVRQAVRNRRQTA